MSKLSDSVSSARYSKDKGHLFSITTKRDILADRVLVGSKKIVEIEQSKSILKNKVITLQELFNNK